MLGNFTEINDQTSTIGIDIETVDPFLKTTGVSWIRREGCILGIAVKIDNEPSQYYPLRHPSGNYNIDRVREYFNNMFKIAYQNDISIVGHYLYYDLGWLDHDEFLNIDKCPPLFDTLIGGQLYNSNMIYSLKMMSRYFQVGEKTDIDAEQLRTMLMSIVERYACNDIDLTMRLYDKLVATIPPEAVFRENALIPILVMMKKNGIKVDEEALINLRAEFERRLDSLMNIIREVDSNIKIWSGTSVEFLFRRLGIGYPRTDHGNPSFNAAFLEEVGKINPVIKALSQARKIHKLNGTFLEGIKRAMVGNSIHSDYFNGKSEDGGTVTGRLSSANPNMQQVPSRTEEGLMVRSLFVPRGLAWCRSDYSQQEPRLMLHYAALMALETMDYWKELYENNPDQDFYNVLMEVTKINDRNIMKTNTLALSYGMGEDHMSDIMGISVQEARKYKSQFNNAVPWLMQLSTNVQGRALQNGKIKTLGGRYLRFSQGTASKSFNHLIQGSAADQTKQAMIDIYRITGKVPLSQVHDELNYDLSEEDLENHLDETITQIMKDAIKLEFPTKVDTTLGLNWREACGK